MIDDRFSQPHSKTANPLKLLAAELRGMRSQCVFIKTRAAIFVFLLVLTSSHTSEVQQNGWITHTVQRGESVSLLCIDYYGYYSKELGAAFQKDNPGVPDINLILTGQVLRFRAPQAPAAAPSGLPSVNDTLYVKKLQARQGVVTCVSGSAALHRNRASGKAPLLVNTLVYPGDTVITLSDGRVEMIINRETVVRLRERTSAVIAEYRNPANDRGKTKIGFSAGAVWTKMKAFRDKIGRFELELPVAVAGVHGTVYQAVVKGDSSAEVMVYSGEVAVRNRADSQKGPAGKKAREVSGPHEVDGPAEVDLETWTRIVRSMQKVTIDKNGRASGPVPFSLNAASDWESWNRERDQRISRMFQEKEE